MLPKMFAVFGFIKSFIFYHYWLFWESFGRFRPTFWVWKMFGSGNILGAEKDVGPKKIWVRKKIGSGINLGPEKCGSGKI